MIFTRGRYKIDFKDKAYIEAIATHNKKIRITHIRENEGKEISLSSDQEKSGQALPEMIAKMKLRDVHQIEIKYRTANAYTLFEVFPPIPPINKNYSLSPQQYEVAERLGLRLNDLEEANRLDIAIGYAEPLFKSSLDRKQALSLFPILKQQINCSGAMHLRSVDSIIFENEGSCYSLTYGENPVLNDMNALTLDIDDGFFYKYPEEASELNNLIKAELQKFFIRWKEAHYNGRLIPLTAGLCVENSQLLADYSLIESGFNNSLNFNEPQPQVNNEAVSQTNNEIKSQGKQKTQAQVALQTDDEIHVDLTKRNEPLENIDRVSTYSYKDSLSLFHKKNNPIQSVKIDKGLCSKKSMR